MSSTEMPAFSFLVNVDVMIRMRLISLLADSAVIKCCFDFSVCGLCADLSFLHNSS